jgi:hypothetical protein
MLDVITDSDGVCRRWKVELQRGYGDMCEHDAVWRVEEEHLRELKDTADRLLKQFRSGTLEIASIL